MERAAVTPRAVGRYPSVTPAVPSLPQRNGAPVERVGCLRGPLLACGLHAPRGVIENHRQERGP
jgi:hypothetical protein